MPMTEIPACANWTHNHLLSYCQIPFKTCVVGRVIAYNIAKTLTSANISLRLKFIRDLDRTAFLALLRRGWFPNSEQEPPQFLVITSETPHSVRSSASAREINPKKLQNGPILYDARAGLRQLETLPTLRIDDLRIRDLVLLEMTVSRTPYGPPHTVLLNQHKLALVTRPL